jgi:NADPH2:quinone reductase
MRSAAVFAGIREGWLKLKVNTVLPLADAAQAHRLLEGRKSMGKIVLKVRE